MKRIFTPAIVVGLGLFAAAGNLAASVTLTNLLSFNGPNGAFPFAALVQGSEGNFYGTTAGDAPTGGSNYLGSVFRISPSGSFTNLHTFPAFTGDGNTPMDALVQGSDGNFYGTTAYGGTSNCGTVFLISPSGNYTNLYSFSGPDGAGPEGTLVRGSDGNFYGTTAGGGTSNSGTVFLISPSGNLTNLYSFSRPGGAIPIAGLVQGSDGNFYGTTYYGGTSNLGTVFVISPSGSLTNLYSFSGSDGALPWAGLVQGGDGNFYGTTENGGAYNPSGNPGTGGTVFRISPSGSFTNLHSFGGPHDDGYAPLGVLVHGSDGNFYGTTAAGGYFGGGTVFWINPSGSYTNFFDFFGEKPAQPFAGLVQGSDGNFYGTTWLANGNVFKLVVPLNPLANQISAIQVADTNVVITISSVASETYQLQCRDSLAVGGWSNVVGAAAQSIGGSLTITNFGGFSQSQQFYRFAITP